MRKFTLFLLPMGIVFIHTNVLALHETTPVVNAKYTDYIKEAIEQSNYTEKQMDKDNIYIVEKTNLDTFKSGEEITEFYIAIPLLGTDDIAYSVFRDKKYHNEYRNSASMMYTENYMNTNIEKYIAENRLENITEVVSTIFFGRTAMLTYRVVANSETYFIPYYCQSGYNFANDEACALEFGKAYKAEDFTERLEKEKNSYTEYREAQKKAEEERIKEEAEKEASKYRPTVSLDENGDEVIKVNGTNLDEILKELKDNIKTMGFSSTINMNVDNDYQVKYRWQQGCNTSSVSNFAEGLFDEFKTQITTGKPDEAQNTSCCNFNLKHDEGYKSIKHQVEINIWETGVKIEINRDNVIEFKIKSAEPIISYMNKHSNNSFDGFSYEKNDENTPHIRGPLENLTKTDVIEFTFTLPQNENSGISEEVASAGTTVTGLFEKYKENQYKSTYILTLTGDIGTVSYYTQKQSSISGDKERFSNNIPVSFNDKYRIENNNMVEYPVGKSGQSYDFKMIFENNDISKVYFENTECTDLKYTSLSSDKKLSEEYTEKNKEIVLKDAEECADTLYELKLFRGTDKGYELEKSLTREESATILVRLLGEEVSKDDFDVYFKDVDKNRWSFPYVMYCYQNNITKGTGNYTFSPDSEIDAEQFIALLMRLLGYTGVNPETALDKSVEYRLLPSSMVKKLQNSDIFTRSEMVQIVYSSLKTKMPDEIIFSDYLFNKGVLTQTEIGLIN